VEPWAIVGRARKYDNREGADIDIGWAWDLARSTERRVVHVEVAAGLLERTDLPDACRRAIRDRGRSEVAWYMGEDEPPTRILVASTGLVVERN
jgi:hypothetical protein